MNSLLIISLIAVASVVILPVTFGEPAADGEQKTFVAANAAIVPASVVNTQNLAGEIWQEDDREVLIRSTRGAKNNGNGGSGKRDKKRLNQARKNSTPNPLAGESVEHKEIRPIQTDKPIRNERRGKNQKKSSSCRYEKSQWTECNPETNIRTRVLTLKKGDEGCVQTRTIEKKCKKACRYDRGEWSKCVNGTMTRKDNIRPGCDASCKPTRDITKNCNKDKKNKKQDKNGRKGHQ